MAVEIHVTQAGDLSLVFSGQSTAAALTLAREYVPDIDERLAAFAANFQPGGAGDAAGGDGVPGDDDRGSGTQGSPEAGSGSGAAGAGTSEPEGVLDAGGRVAQAEQAVDTPTCSICDKPVKPDWADITKQENGAVLCPAHTA